MRDSLRLGRFGGVGVGAHWSLAAVVVLVAYGLARSRLPSDAPGHSTATYALVGGATAVGLIVAVLVHEIGHAVLARRAGLSVDGITLSWMGGVTRIEGDATGPGWEAAIAGIGPAASLLVAGACAIGRAVAEGAGASSLLVAALGWLALINVSLAVFNLVPAAPLDGGRVLHAGLWKLTGDRWQATRITARIGMGFGVGVVAFSFLLFTRQRSGLQPLLLAAVGYWLISSARAENQAGNVRQTLDGTTLSELMRPVGSAPGWITVGAFIDGYDSARPGWVWLLEGWGGGYQAVVAGEAVRAVPPQQWGAVRPVDLSVPVTSVAGGHPGDDALASLARTGGTQIILVVDGGRTVGAVLPSDVEALLLGGGRRGAQGPAPAGARAH